jgi:hypothetical protein
MFINRTEEVGHCPFDSQCRRTRLNASKATGGRGGGGGVCRPSGSSLGRGAIAFLNRIDRLRSSSRDENVLRLDFTRIACAGPTIVVHYFFVIFSPVASTDSITIWYCFSWYAVLFLTGSRFLVCLNNEFCNRSQQFFHS